ncbi:MAG: aromatic amino acid transaminase [Pseudomonadota bacterium]
MFASLGTPKPDALHGVLTAYNNDPRPDKIDLGVGMYKDETGRCPVMDVVKQAEFELFTTQTSKGYQGLDGDASFLNSMLELVLGRDHLALLDGRVAAIQTAGGTGALRMAGALLNECDPNSRIFIGTPTWPAHNSVFAAAGLEVYNYDYLSADLSAADAEKAMSIANGLMPSDALLMHGVGHNPTGIDLTMDQRREIYKKLASSGTMMVMDTAYYGLVDGLASDCQVIRTAAQFMPRALFAVSCSKSFGLYRERTGLLIAICATKSEREVVQKTLQIIGRKMWSMPPAHGAACVAHILQTTGLRNSWIDEVENMRARVASVRRSLTTLSDHPALKGVLTGKGIFSMLSITEAQVSKLASDFGIYMPRNGRVNLAGFKTGDEARFVEALNTVTQELVS